MGCVFYKAQGLPPLTTEDKGQLLKDGCGQLIFPKERGVEGSSYDICKISSVGHKDILLAEY